MNINIDELKKLRSGLEKDYNKLDKKIAELYLKENITDASIKEQEQSDIDKRINMIDDIIFYLNKSQKIYDKLMNNVGE